MERVDGGGGEPSHLVLLCRRPLAPALSGSCVDPWTCHLDFPTNHIKVSSLGIHQAKWILDPDRPDGEKAQGNPSLLWSDMIYLSSVLAPSLLPSVPVITSRHWVWCEVQRRTEVINMQMEIYILWIKIVGTQSKQRVRQCGTLKFGLNSNIFICVLWRCIKYLRKITYQK